MSIAIDTWTEVHEERQALLDLLETLGPEQWDTQSLCSEWRVRDVVGHLIANTEVKLVVGIAGIVASGFSINRYISKVARRRGAAPIPQLLADFRDALTRRSSPPGQSAESMLGDVVIHRLDICLPLHKPRQVASSRMVHIASDLHTNTFYAGPKLVKGLRVIATDADWSAGEGPEVAGPIEALVLMLSGRPVALDELSGNGLATLRERAGV